MLWEQIINKLVVEPCFNKSKNSEPPQMKRTKAYFFCHWLFDFDFPCKIILNKYVNLNAGQHFEMSLGIKTDLPKLIMF